ncbi:LysE family translocator [Nordella sp. HKS 07]|uniref:LysE family translocator n=1 Tax=Nordella sp. HKS 07 TaxID=2712222 RepID=UPI0013E159E2|nr:LysE family translocator [Nordella sp. HKS 07]QIG51126.1 LysE family translocator [Nordella sp. HKS 07]
MPPIEHLLPFLFATLLFAVMPGPAILYMTAQTMAFGSRAGIMAALGIHIGCYAHIIAASIGLAAVLTHFPGLYVALKLAGAAYLVWLGLRMLSGTAGPQAEAASSGKAAFRESIVVEILNPKTALFFVAFLPQFVDPAAAWPVGLQFLALGVIVNLALSFADLGAVGLAALARGRLFAQPRGNRVLFTASGSILIGLGVLLAVQSF